MELMLATASERFTKIADPFLRFWFRFVEPNRSRVQARQVTAVAREIDASFSQHVSRRWEELARASVVPLDCHGRTWRPASRWWGAGLDRKPMEIDVVAECDDGKAVLRGEVSWSKTADGSRLLQHLRRKAENFPGATRREIVLALWMRMGPSSLERTPIYSPGKVLSSSAIECSSESTSRAERNTQGGNTKSMP